MLTHRMLHRIAPAIFTTQPGLPLEIPGPASSRWLSTAGPMLPWASDSLGHAEKLFDKYGPVVALVRGGGTRHITKDKNCPGTVLCYGADINQTIAKEHELFAKNPLSGSLYPGESPKERLRPLLSFGAGLFDVNGEDHRRQRRMLSEVFSRRRLQGYAREMELQTQRMLAGWRMGEERDLSHEMRHLTSKIVTASLFGRGHEELSMRASSHLVETLRLLGTPSTKLLAFDMPGLSYRRYLMAATKLEQEMKRLVALKREETEPADDMLQALLEARDEQDNSRLSDAEILGHVSIFFAAGHETTANGLSWTLLLLSRFPEVREQVCRELKDVVGDRSVTYDDLENLQYLGAVLKESLRLFPPAPWNGRVLSADTHLAGYTLPAGTEVLFSIYRTQRNPDVFQKPRVFSPERWRKLSPSAYDYSPFSTGPRTCIGAAFATLEMKIVLATLLGKFQLELLPQRIDRFAEMVLSPKPGVKMRLTEPGSAPPAQNARLSGNVDEMVEFPECG